MSKLRELVEVVGFLTDTPTKAIDNQALNDAIAEYTLPPERSDLNNSTREQTGTEPHKDATSLSKVKPSSDDAELA